MPDSKGHGLMRIMSSSSSNEAGAGGRWWRAKKLGSRDYTLRERPTNGSGDGDGVVESSESVANGAATTQYRTYKRRWFGLIQLTLMNIVVSWDVSIFP